MNENVAIVLAGGSGRRMNSSRPKQYLDINGFPILFYSLDVFQSSPIINRIILVTLEEDIEYCKREIADKYKLTKITDIVAGGGERYESVYNGLKIIKNTEGFVFIHDSARPCINEELIQNLYDDAILYGTSIAAVKTKDTVKISDAEGFVIETPDRNDVFIIQTPQVFDIELIKSAYAKMINSKNTDGVTDDAMVMERFGSKKVKLSEGNYSNIKATTPEDMHLLSVLLKKMRKKQI